DGWQEALQQAGFVQGEARSMRSGRDAAVLIAAKAPAAEQPDGVAAHATAAKAADARTAWIVGALDRDGSGVMAALARRLSGSGLQVSLTERDVAAPESPG